MGKWKPSEYNANYILSKPLLVEQLKYENTSKGRLEEICVERYESGECNLIFTVQASADKDRMGKIDFNSLFDDLKNKFNIIEGLKFNSSFNEVHTMYAKSGAERQLTEVLTRLEQYDNSLVDITKSLLDVIGPHEASHEDIKRAQERLKKRKALLDATEKHVGKRRRSMTKQVAQRKRPARRKTTAKGRSRG